MSDLAMLPRPRACADGWRSAARLLPEFPHDLIASPVPPALPGPWRIARQQDAHSWTILRVVRLVAATGLDDGRPVLEYHGRGLFSFLTDDQVGAERSLAQACALVDQLSDTGTVP